MEWIERYLQAVGRSLPAAQRADILSELRSSLYDALEGDEKSPNEAEVVALLKQMGPPQQVASAYYPTGQYLIGPSLYPLFRMVMGIVFTVVISLQLLGTVFALFFDTSRAALLNSSWEVVNALLTAFAAVVLIFWALQYLDVKPDMAAEFNPLDLPALEADSEAVSRSSHVFSIIFNVVILVILTRFAQRGGFAWLDGRGFFANPIISQYLPLIFLASLAEIGIDIVVMWQGYWRRHTRFASLLVNLFSLGLLLFLLWAHDAWLATQGVAGILTSIEDIPALLTAQNPLVGMLLFRIGLVCALPFIAYEAVASGYFFIRSLTLRSPSAMAHWTLTEHK